MRDDKSIVNAGTLDLNGFADSIVDLTINGGNVTTGAGFLNVRGDIAASNSTFSSYAGNLHFEAPTANAARNITVATGGLFDVSGVIANGDNGLTAQFNKQGGGSLIFSGNTPNTYTGDTVVNGGTLVLSKLGQGPDNSFGSAMGGNLIVNSGTIVRYGASSQVRDDKSITVNAGGTLDLNGLADSITDLVINGGSVTTGNGYVNVRGTLSADNSTTSAYAGNLHLEAATAGALRDVSVGTGGLFTLSGVVSNGDNGVATQLNKTGAGTLVLSGNNTYSGGTTITAGTLQVGSGGTSGSLGSGTSVTNNAALVFNRADALTVGAVISGSGTLTQAGAGILTLTGLNTFTGGTTVDAGTLVVGNGTQAASLVRGAAPNGTGAPGAAAVSLKNDSQLQVRTLATVSGGNAGSSSGGFSFGGVGGAGVSIVNGGSVTNSGGTIQGGSGGGFVGSSGFGGDGGVGVSFSGSGGSLVNAGTIRGGTRGSGSFGNGASGVAVSFSGGAGSFTNQRGGLISGNSNGDGVLMDGNYANAVTLQVGSTIAGTLNIGTHAGSTLTLTDNGSGGTQAYSAAVTGATTFAGMLTKTGSGTWNLDRPLGYGGGSQVNAGTLLANNASGSATGSGPVAVNSGATLGGGGTIAGDVTVNGGATLAPGNSPGRLNLGGNLTLASGSTLAIELGGTAAGSEYDQVLLAGALTLGGSNLRVSLVNGFTLGVGQVGTSFVILDNASSTDLTGGSFANAPGGLYTDANGNVFQVNYAANADSGPLPNDVSLTFLGSAPIPEPSTWTMLLIASGGALLGAARRRRVNSASRL